MEALRFSAVERSAGTAMDNYQTTCLLLQLTMDYCAKVKNTKDEIPWRIAMLGYKLDLGKLFASLGAKPQAEIWFNNLEAEFVECISLMNDTDSTLQASDSLDLLTVELHRLKMVEKEEPTQARLQQLLILGDKMQAASHIETESAHFLAIAWAKKLYPSNEFAVLQTDIQFRSQNLFRTQGRVSSEMTNLVDIMTPVLNSEGGVARTSSYVELARRIEALQEFERMHPHITLPTVKHMHSSMLLRLQTQVGQREEKALIGAMQATHHAFALSMPSGDTFRREVSITTPNEQSLKVKDILDQREVENHEFNMDYSFHSRPEQVVVPELLQRLVFKEVASGNLTEHALSRLFGSGAKDTKFETDHILKMQGKELLNNLVGTPEHPLHAKQWAQRRPTLRSWLLDDSCHDYRLRQCLWIAIHNRRSNAWSEHVQLKLADKEFRKLESPKLVHADCIGKSVHTITPGWFQVNCELISAIQERLDLREMKLVSPRSNDHFGREWWIARSILSQLYLNFFFCCHNPGNKLSDGLIEFLARADEIARDQVAYWRRIENSQFFATEVIYISTITQLRIEFGITNDPAEVARTVDETLALLEEVELLFGTTLYEVDLSRTLDFLNMKSYMGSGMGIWQIGKIAIRLLSLVIVQIGNKAQSGFGDEDITTRRQRRLGQLWQWVQRVKARTLAQSMGLDNEIPDSMLVEIQRSLTDERASVEKELATSASNLGSAELAILERRLADLNLEVESAPPLEFLSQVRNILKDSNDRVGLEIASNSIDRSFIQDLRRLSKILKQLKRPEASHIEDKANIEQEMSLINERMAARPSLQKLVTIADFLNREEVLRNSLEVTSDRLQNRIELQRLRNEMRQEPVLERMLRIREGRPVSDQDLHKIAATRGGKVAFIDWITITNFQHKVTRVYMLIWRNGICKGVDLGTEHGFQQASVKEFFDVKDVYLPDVSPTPLDEMNLEEMAPTAAKEIADDDLKPVLSCFELVKPLFNDSLVEKGDLLVLSLTEGFHNFPLHAIQEDEDGDVGPLILEHPVVYVPSLSVLHKCFWSRNGLSSGHNSSKDDKMRALVLGGIVSPKPVFQYGTKAVGKIGDILRSSETTFIGKDATLHNFSTHISKSDVLHIHLHTNYGDKSSKRSEHGHLSQEDAEDVTFVNSPLDQAILFNGAETNNKLTTAQIIELNLSKGAHCNLMACASGRQGTYQADLRRAKATGDVMTNEVMGLVPGFLFSGAGSVTSTLWPIMDEHGAVFSNYFFREFMEARKKARSQLTLAEMDLSWIDLAEVHQKAVLDMRRIYKQPSAWAGFVLSGCWKFQV